MNDYKQASQHFIQNEKQFQLGAIPTEQSNPITRGLSGKIKRNTCEGVKVILDADCNIAPVSSECFAGETFRQLVQDIRRCIDERRRIHFSSVGASGRMALQLESAWRAFWLGLTNKLPIRAKEWLEITECVNSFMTGGDRACVRSVENFEDYQTFGAQQTLDSGITEGDILVVLAECSLSSSTIGSACQGADMGIPTYYLYCNPKEILCEHLERARRVFSYDSIRFMPLYVGNMAVSGSTRMQVTTVELLVAGAAIEIASWGWLQDHLNDDELAAIGVTALDPEEYPEVFKSIVHQLQNGEALQGLAKAVEFETATYSQRGLVTYATHAYLQDILTDTTERQPTFTLPPFRRSDDQTSPVSWAYAKDPLYSGATAWQHIIRRPLKGIEWTRDMYLRLGAEKSICDNPPKIGSGELLYYDLGNSDDPSRYSQHPAQLVLVDVDGQSAADGCVNWYRAQLPKFDGGLVLRFGKIPETKIDEDEIRVPVDVPRTLMDIPTHLFIKLSFNVLSTGTMAKMGRVRSNWMVQLLPTNKKLIDRSTRIISALARIPYQQANEEFFKSYLGRPKEEEYRESYVMETLTRLGIDPDDE